MKCIPVLSIAVGVAVAVVTLVASGQISGHAVKPQMLDKNVYIVDVAAAEAATKVSAATAPSTTMEMHGHDHAASAESSITPIAELLAKASIEAGQKTAKVCGTCHSFGKGEAAKVGPNLYGVVGGPHAHMEGFKYSDAMMGMKDHKWDFEELNQFIYDPRAHLPGTKMTFAGLKNDQERANVIAWLNSLSDHPLPLPK